MAANPTPASTTPFNQFIAARDLEELENLPIADRAAALNELVDQLEEELERTRTNDRQGVDEP